MATFTLTRTGKPPLSFSGELVAEASGKWHAGKEANRWHDLAIYKTDGGKFVASIIFNTCWQGELSREAAEAFDSEADVIRFFTDHEPAGYVKGFPAHESYRDRQEALLADVTNRYRDRVGELLAEAGYSETVT